MLVLGSNRPATGLPASSFKLSTTSIFVPCITPAKRLAMRESRPLRVCEASCSADAASPSRSASSISGCMAGVSKTESLGKYLLANSRSALRSPRSSVSMSAIVLYTSFRVILSGGFGSSTMLSSYAFLALAVLPRAFSLALIRSTARRPRRSVLMYLATRLATSLVCSGVRDSRNNEARLPLSCETSLLGATSSESFLMPNLTLGIRPALSSAKSASV